MTVHDTSLLLVSIAALALAPLLYRIADAARATLLALDGFVMFAIAGLVLVHILPQALAAAGPLALVLAALGFLGPMLVEHGLHHGAARTTRTHAVTLGLACLGLVAHAFVDGVALGAPALGHGHDHGQVISQDGILAVAIILHRLPVAMTIWWLLEPSRGPGIAAGFLSLLAGATVLGFLGAEAADQILQSRWVGLVQALVAGALLHVVVHRPSPLCTSSLGGRGYGYAGLGGIAGLVLVGVLADGHGPSDLGPGLGTGTIDFAATFETLALASAPALLLGFALTGLVQVFWPRVSIDRMATGPGLVGAARGVALGLSLPTCSSRVLLMYRALIAHGVPATTVVAYLVATSTLGLGAVAVSLPLLGAELTLARIMAAAIVALSVGHLVGRRVAGSPAGRTVIDHPTASSVPVDLGGRLRHGLRSGLAEVVDHLGPWLLLGLVIASLAEPMFDAGWLASLPWGVDVVLVTLVGMPVYVCASGATPVIAVLVHEGLSPGAGLALLLAGSTTSITTLGVLARLHGRRVAAGFAAAITGLVVALGLIVNLVLPESQVIALDQLADEPPGVLARASLVVLALIFALSLLRQGPRAQIARVLAPHGDRESR